MKGYVILLILRVHHPLPKNQHQITWLAVIFISYFYLITRSSYIYNHAGEGVFLTNENQASIINYLREIFEPLPSWRNTDPNTDPEYKRKRKLTMAKHEDDRLQMITSLNTRNNNSILKITSITVFKWKILFICTIIISFT